MATTRNYDARRVSDAEAQDSPVFREIRTTLSGSPTAVVGADPNDMLFFELPGGDLSGEEPAVAVMPQRADEFTCSSCFLVQHRSRLRRTSSGLAICADCV